MTLTSKNFALDKPLNVIYRADGSSVFGIGHILRGIAIAQTLRKANVETIFFIKNYTGIKSLICSYKFKCFTINSQIDLIDETYVLINYAEQNNIDFLIFDLNHKETVLNKKNYLKYIDTFKCKGYFLVVIDGMNQECLSLTDEVKCNVLLMPYLNSERMNYIKLKRTKILAGINFFPFRDDFFSEPGTKINRLTFNVLISMGGADVLDFNNKIYSAINSIKDFKLNVKFLGELSFNNFSTHNIKVIKNSQNMSRHLKWADVAIIGSGLTRYEASFLGVPALILSINKMHEDMILDFVKTCSSLYLGDINSLSTNHIAKSLIRILLNAKLRKKMSKNGKFIFNNYSRFDLPSELLDSYKKYSSNKSHNYLIGA